MRTQFVLIVADGAGSFDFGQTVQPRRLEPGTLGTRSISVVGMARGHSGGATRTVRGGALFR